MGRAAPCIGGRVIRPFSRRDFPPDEFDLPLLSPFPFYEQAMGALLLHAAASQRKKRGGVLLCDPEARLLPLCEALIPRAGFVRVYTNFPEAYESLRAQALCEWGAPLVVSDEAPYGTFFPLTAALSPSDLPPSFSPDGWVFTCSFPRSAVPFPGRMICAYETELPPDLAARFPGYPPGRLASLFVRGTLQSRLLAPRLVTCVTAAGTRCGYSSLFPDSTGNNP